MKNDWQVGAVYVVSTPTLTATGKLTALTPTKLLLGEAVWSDTMGEMRCGPVWIERAWVTTAYRQIITCAYTPVQLPLHEAVTN
jgi:hypothetical protein